MKNVTARSALVAAIFAGILLAGPVFTQQAPSPVAPSTPAPTPGTPAPGTPAPTTPQTPGRGTAGAGQGDPDPGVHFVVSIDNPSVRVLQVTVQPGATRREHVHNDVTFHMLVPVTGSLELTAAGLGTITAAPGQAYYMVKGQPHAFTNKSAAPVQVIEVFVKGPAPEPWKAEAK